MRMIAAASSRTLISPQRKLLCCRIAEGMHKFKLLTSFK
ncbi:unnamed protein product, partial [Linum tenue]